MVKTSVQEIQQECGKMLEIADSLERIDTYFVASAVRKALTNLTTEFNKNCVIDERRIEFLKQQCESAAIRLEYCLVQAGAFDSSRYEERNLIYNCCKQYNQKKTKNIDVLLFNRFVNELDSEADHLIFKLSDIQKQEISLLQEIM